MAAGVQRQDFFSRLERRIKSTDSLLCVGLDPHTEDLKEFFITRPEGYRKGRRFEELSRRDLALVAYDFCSFIIDNTQEFACCFKPNSAFFEALGGEGLIELEKICVELKKRDIPIILDVKRGDISSTAEAYAKAAYDIYHAGAVTVNPYMGRDSISPFLNYTIEDPATKNGVFVLCRTSNDGAKDLQKIPDAEGEALYMKVASMASGLQQRGGVGVVIGATDVEALSKVRQAHPLMWILCPGVGTQGGDLEGALNAGLRKDGSGILIPISRSIYREWNDKGVSGKARLWKEMINKHRPMAAPQGDTLQE